MPIKSLAFCIAFPVLFASQAALALSYTGIAYEIGSNKQKALYKYERDGVQKGDKEEIHGAFKDMQGEVAVEETLTVQGSKFVKLEIDQKQLKQSAKIEVIDGKINFTKTADGKTTTVTEDLDTTLVSGGNMQYFIRDHWAEIAKGETVSFRFAVWERQETVGFKIFKTGIEGEGVDKRVILKMKPTSFIIAALVDPLIFRYNEDGSHLMELRGRMPARLKVGDKYKELDADLVYSY